MAELQPAYTPQEAAVEASRCLFCFDAPCIMACPTGIDIPSFIKKIETENIIGAARTILSANILGASCARVCPTEVLCEGACVMVDRQRDPIKIGRLQRFATDYVYERGLDVLKSPDQKIRETDCRDWRRARRRRMRGRTSPTRPQRGDL